MVDLGRWFSDEYRISEKLEESDGLHMGKRLRIASGAPVGIQKIREVRAKEISWVRRKEA